MFIADNSFGTVKLLSGISVSDLLVANLCVHIVSSIFLYFVFGLVSVPLEKPEEFLLQIHKMDHFAERLECWLYRNKFTETSTAIGKTKSV